MGVVVLGALGHQSLGLPSPSPERQPSLARTAPPLTAPSSGTPVAELPPAPLPPLRGQGDAGNVLGLADGAVPDGVTVFDGEVPAVANLDAGFLAALRRAGSDAGGDGVQVQVNSGWRSRAYQEQLLREAVAEYGSEEEAARWVSSPERSAHVSGDAIDVGGSGAIAWLSRHGAGYGLCQIYDNEPWHFELRLDAVDQGCPDRYADPATDPRMQP